jgi:hypothetical protein
MSEETQDAYEYGNQVSLTVYIRGAALVRDRRVIELNAGLNTLEFENIASQIDVSTITFCSLTDPSGTMLLEYHYVYEPIDGEMLLNRYIGQVVEIVMDDGVTLVGELVSGYRQSAAQNGRTPFAGDYNREIVLLQADGRVVAIRVGRVRDMHFPPLPAKLSARPLLRCLIESPRSGPQQIEITYLSQGLNWSADHNVLLAADNKTLNLNSWIHLANNSGATFNEAHLKLVAAEGKAVAGEEAPSNSPFGRLGNRLPGTSPPPSLPFNRPSANPPPNNNNPFANPRPGGGGLPPAPTRFGALSPLGKPLRQLPEVAPERAPEQQIFEIKRPVTLPAGETKYIEYLSAVGLPATLYFTYDASVRFQAYPRTPNIDRAQGVNNVMEVQSWLEFSTSFPGQTATTLPAGQMRVYQEDIRGAVMLLTEERIDHAPAGKEVQIILGKANEIFGKRTLKNFRRINTNMLEETYRVRLRSYKEDGTVEVRIPERMFRWGNWRIMSASHEYVKTSPTTIEFRVPVQPGRRSVIFYTVRYSWTE